MPLFRCLLACLLALALFAQGVALRADVSAAPVADAAVLSSAADLPKPPAWEGGPQELIGETLAVALSDVAAAETGRGMELPGLSAPAGKGSPYLDGIERPPRA